MKTFGIGLHKCGTDSLVKGMRALGLRVSHDWQRSQDIAEALNEGKDHPDVGRFDGILDGMLIHAVNALSQRYGDEARFIFTTRPCEAWINSAMIHVLHNRVEGDSLPGKSSWRDIDTKTMRENYPRIHRRLATGLDLDDPRLLIVRLGSDEEWQQQLPGDSPIWDIVKRGRPLSWETLCQFFGMKTPPQDFPKANDGAWRLRRVLIARGDDPDKPAGIPVAPHEDGGPVEATDK